MTLSSREMFDWDKCALCQDDKEEQLQCPANSKRSDVGSGYKTLASNLKQFKDLDPEFLTTLFEVTDGDDIERSFVIKQAKWHKSCSLQFNNTKLTRARKRHSEDSDAAKSATKKPTRSSLGSLSDVKWNCFFCDKPENKEPLHSVTTLPLDNKIRQFADKLQDASLLLKLSCEGDLVAREAKYHKSCLTTLRNKVRSQIKSKESSSNENVLHGIVLAELVSYIEEFRTDDKSKDVVVFKLKDLVSMYNSRLEQLDFAGASINSTRLKERILASLPDVKAHQKGRDVLLAFDSDIGIALHRILEEDDDTEAKHLASAAAIIRKEMLLRKSNFQGTFDENCQEDSIPSCLISLVKMILYGPNIQDQMKNNTSQAALTISQLLQFNCIGRQRKGTTGKVRHTKERETPVPIYVGLSTHALTRKRELVDSLHKLGVSISYDRVLSISTDVGNAACRRFEEEGVLCPTKLRKELFTTAAIDNIDHNTSSTTAQNSFHGTGISLFQNVSSVECGIERNEVNIEHRSGLPTKTVCPLPSWYAEVPPCVLMHQKPVVPVVPQHEEVNLQVLTKTIKEEHHWLTEVLMSTTADDYNGESPVTWGGYHSRYQTDGTNTIARPAITSLLPLFSHEAKSAAMIRHAMDMIKAATEYLNPGQVPVIAVDQPLYSVAKQIQWNLPDSHGEKQFVFMFGGLHVEMATLAVLGDWLEGSGWTSALIQANVASSGVADSFCKGKHVKRTRHAHQVTASALYKLLHTAYNHSKDKGEITDSLSIDDWCKQRSAASPHFQFWYIALQLELVYFAFVRSIRESNFPLYISTLSKLVPWFFALDHSNYSRWVPVHLRDMMSICQTLPQTYYKLKTGGFTVQKSARVFSAMAIDQAHEQNNKLVKGEGGAVGLTESAEALRRWMISGPEIARMVHEFEGCLTEETSERKEHHEEAKNLQLSFVKDVQSLVSVIEDMGNPFMEETNELLVLDTRDIADTAVVKTVRTIEAVGQEQYETFRNERITNNKKSLYDPIKRNKLPLFKTPLKKVPSKEKQKITSLKTDCALFSRLFISCQTRNEDLDEFFSHENQGCPPSLSQNGELLLPSSKSDLLDCLAMAPSSQPTSNIPQCIDVIVLDGAAIINMLKPAKDIKTFGDYIHQVFIPYIKGQLRHVKRIDVVFDEYLDNSLKRFTRTKRGKGVRRRVEASTLVPIKGWQEFLRVDGNKKELFSIIAEHVSLVEFDQGKEVFITKGPQVLSSPLSCSTANLTPSNHEEADTRMLVHVTDAASSGHRRIAIRSVDTDVVVICIGSFYLLPQIELWVIFGTGEHLRSYPIHDITHALGPEKSKSLPMFHAFTGCDTVSCFSTKGKKTAWNTWMVYDDVTSAFIELSQQPANISDDTLMKLERYVVLLYHRTSAKMSVNEARKELFAQKSRALNAIPPTQAALKEHIKRATYQGAYCWGQSTTPCMELPSPSEWGWEESPEGWRPLWSTLPDVSNSCKALIKCGCKKGCQKQCSCVKAALKCTALCICGGDCSTNT